MRPILAFFLKGDTFTDPIDGKSFKSDIVLSKVSTNFKNLKIHLEKSGIFNNVFEMDEKNPIELLGDEFGDHSLDNLLARPE